MNLELVSNQVADHMDKMLELWKPGMKITVLVRNPENDEADFCLSSDTTKGVQEMADRIARREMEKEGANA